MKLLEVENLKRSNASGNTPVIKFALSGNIRLNVPAVEKVFTAALTQSKDTDLFLHIYTDDAIGLTGLPEKTLAISLDNNPVQGVRIRFDGVQDGNKRLASNITASASMIVKHLTEYFEWPLAKDKKAVINYTITDPTTLDDGQIVYKCI